MSPAVSKRKRGSNCPICGSRLREGQVRRCESCRKVVCMKCFDMDNGVCRKCLEKYDLDGPSPDYIA